MDNYECLAYSLTALKQLQKEGKEITEYTLKAKITYLMDMYSEKEIYKMYCEGRF